MVEEDTRALAALRKQLEHSRQIAFIGASPMEPLVSLPSAAFSILHCIARGQGSLADADLKQTEELSSRMIEGGGDCVCVLDTSGHILTMNSEGQRRLEVERLGAVLHTSWLDLWPAESSANARQAIGQARTGTIGRFRAAAQNFAGQVKWWDVAVMPVRGASGQAEKIIAIARDLTDAQAAEEKFSDPFRGYRRRAPAFRTGPNRRL
jgi:PAS domain S-box-containing protein